MPMLRVSEPLRRSRFRLLAFALGAWLACGHFADAQAAEPDTAADAEEAGERRTMERFQSLLEKNPRRGTALDRVYGFHVERGTLDALIKTYRDRVSNDPKDGAGWMILGLLESQCGRDAAAVEALGSAESARPDDPIASYYLGQALVLVGKPDEAASAFERAIERKPRRSDLLDIFQSLGRVYQRAQKTEQALAVWNRLEALFPADLRVQEQIASALAEEGQTELALPRFEALAKKATDPFRKVQLSIQAADLKVRLGRSEPALRDYETLLGNLRPESWLFREVRRKAEDVFLRNDDNAGLARYYEGWIGKHPDDVEALVRLARTLQNLGRTADARTWYDKAVKLAPSRRDLRLALISQLEIDKKYDEASAQYEALDRSDPNNPDTLRDWGALRLRDTSKPEDQRKQAAAAVWGKMLENRPKDPVTTTQVADLFRQAGLVDEALGLYRKAIELAPENPQYHEYAGEFLHTLKRADEALAAWSKIAEGPNRNSKNLARLGEVLAGFGYTRKALEPMSEAVKLEGDDFALRLKLADLFFKNERNDDSRVQLAAARKLADKEEEKAAVVEAEIKTDQVSGKVAERLAELSKAVEADPNAPTELRLKRARYLEADGKLAEAHRAVEEALAADPRSIPAWTLAARLRESGGNLGDAADAFRRLAEVDRRNRSEYLTGVAKLESRLGRTDAALKAGRDLIAAAPGNPDSYQFYADLCFQLNRTDEGLDALRRAVRVNPNDTKVVLALAETLAGQFRTDEAIEMFWRAFDKADGLDGKLGVIPRLTEQYLQKNQFDRLLSRLQRQEQETGGQLTQQQQREQSICLAQAYASSGDIGSARAELERLLSANNRDVQLLQQLSKLAEDEGDIESAARYLKQQNELAPSDENATRLANLYARAGETDEAQALWSRLAGGHADPAKVFTAVDSLLGNDKPRAALDVTETMIRNNPRDWEALYRNGVALQALGQPDEAGRRFQALLELREDDDHPSASARARKRDPKLNAIGARPSTAAQAQLQLDPLTARTTAATQIRSATKIETRNIILSSTVTRTTWAPGDFGQARMAALAWLYGLAMKDGKEAEKAFLDHYRTESLKTPGNQRIRWDWYYLSLVRNDFKTAHEAAHALSLAGAQDPLGIQIYLNSLTSRETGANPRAALSRFMTQPVETVSPLPADELDHIVASYEILRQRRPDLIGPVTLMSVITELKRANRTDEETRLYREAIATNQQPAQLIAAIYIAASEGDIETLIPLCEKYERVMSNQQVVYYAGPLHSLGQAMGQRSETKGYADILRMLDFSIDSARRRHDALAASPRGRSRASAVSYPVGYIPNYPVWVTRQVRYIQLDFPTPNAYIDSGTISVLRSAYEIYKRDDLSSDLVAHVQELVGKAKTPADAVVPRLALSALLWWDDDKDTALAEFSKAVEGTKADPDLTLSLAELYQQRGEINDALARADSIQPVDNATMQRREELALRLATRAGDIDRARQAAERLFGLRLDTETQLRLSEQMHQLGMHETAEAVLARARRRAGNKATALVGLMLQYQRQGKNDIAAQVALQILRSSSAGRPSAAMLAGYYDPEEPDAARASAMQVLARSGKLNDLIQRTEEQLQHTPGSAQLHLTLADYYTAANQRDKARAELASLVKLHPDDTQLRLRVATMLAQQGQATAAVEHYDVILKKDPTAFGRNFNQVVNAYRQANKLDELVRAIEKLDLRSLGTPSAAMNLLMNLSLDDRNRSQTMSLFKKAWETFPEQRQILFARVQRDEFWRMPEMYDYARLALIPDESSAPFNESTQWVAFRPTMTNSNGSVTSIVSHLLDLAASQGKTDELAGEIEAALKKFPKWTAGRAVLAMLRSREGKFDEAKELLKPVVAAKMSDLEISYRANWVIGAELDRYAETRDLARTFFEREIKGSGESGNLSLDFSPLNRLVSMYVNDGRKDEARRVLLESARHRPSRNYDADYETQFRVQNLSVIGRQLIELGDIADAVPLLNEAVEVADTIQPDGPNYIGNLAQVVQQTRDLLGQSLKGLKDDQVAPTVLRLLGTRSAAEKDKEAAKKPAASVNFVMLIVPRELDKAEVRSLSLPTRS